MLEERTQPTRAYISYTTYFFVLFFDLNNYSFRDPHLHKPRLFYFHDPHSRPHFATHNRIPISRLTFATPLHDSRSRPHSRLSFATPDRAPNRDSLFLLQPPSCDPNTDGRTVLTPQHHLPSVPTLILIKNYFWNLLPGLPSTTSSHPPSCPHPPVALCPLTHLLAPHPLQRPLHLLPGPLPTSTPLSHP